MNLNAYDTIHPKIDKQKTWIDVEKRQLLSRQINYRPYVTISKRYNKSDNTYTYYIIMLDDIPTDRNHNRPKKDNYGRIKISLKSIWNESSLQYYETDKNVDIEQIEQADDGDIYQLNI